MNEGAEVTEKSTPRRHEDTEAMAEDRPGST